MIITSICFTSTPYLVFCDVSLMAFQYIITSSLYYRVTMA